MEQLDSEVPLAPPIHTVAVLYNLKKGIAAKAPDAEAEYDKIDTVHAIRDALAVLDFEGALGHYQADSEGNLVHTIHTQVFKDGAWQLLLTEEYPVE